MNVEYFLLKRSIKCLKKECWKIVCFMLCILHCFFPQICDIAKSKSLANYLPIKKHKKAKKEKWKTLALRPFTKLEECEASTVQNLTSVSCCCCWNMGVVTVVCPFVAKWRLLNIPDNRNRYDLITAVSTDRTVPVMFALHFYLQKQVCSEENYLSVNLSDIKVFLLSTSSI